MGPCAPNQYAAEALYREALRGLIIVTRPVPVSPIYGVTKSSGAQLANRLAVLTLVVGATVLEYESGLADSLVLRCVVAFQT